MIDIAVLVPCVSWSAVDRQVWFLRPMQPGGVSSPSATGRCSFDRQVWFLRPMQPGGVSSPSATDRSSFASFLPAVV